MLQAALWQRLQQERCRWRPTHISKVLEILIFNVRCDRMLKHAIAYLYLQQDVEEVARYAKLQQRLKQERSAVRVLRLEALRERAGRAAEALDSAGLPCPVGAWPSMILLGSYSRVRLAFRPHDVCVMHGGGHARSLKAVWSGCSWPDAARC